MKKELQELNMKGNRDDREVLKMMFTLFICYLVCMIPIAIIQIIDPLKQKIRWHIIPGVIFTGQAIINPFVYAFKNSTYKPAFIKLYQKISFCFPFDTSITTETGETQTKTTFSRQGRTKLKIVHKPKLMTLFEISKFFKKPLEFEFSNYYLTLTEFTMT